MIKKIIILLAFFSSFLSVISCANNKNSAEKNNLSSVDSSSISAYFIADSISPALLEMPLDRNSKEYQKEVEFIIKLQKQTEKNSAKTLIKRAEMEAKVKPEMMFYFTNLKFERNSFPALYHLLDRVYKTSFDITHLSKDYFATKRPYHSEKNIKALVNKIDSGAYPSGHTSSSYLAAKVLSQVMPQYSKIFHQRASEIASNRVLIGAHYPHDIEAGRKLALLMMGALTQNAEFIADLESAKKEVADKLVR